MSETDMNRAARNEQSASGAGDSAEEARPYEPAAAHDEERRPTSAPDEPVATGEDEGEEEFVEEMERDPARDPDDPELKGLKGG